MEILLFIILVILLLTITYLYHKKISGCKQKFIKLESKVTPKVESNRSKLQKDRLEEFENFEMAYIDKDDNSIVSSVPEQFANQDLIEGYELDNSYAAVKKSPDNLDKFFERPNIIDVRIPSLTNNIHYYRSSNKLVYDNNIDPNISLFENSEHFQSECKSKEASIDVIEVPCEDKRLPNIELPPVCKPCQEMPISNPTSFPIPVEKSKCDVEHEDDYIRNFDGCA